MGLIMGFDWPSWSESQRYFDGEPVEDRVVAVKLLTAVVRAERFSEGTLAATVESGVFAGALRVLCGKGPIGPPLQPLPWLPARRCGR